MTTTNTDYLLGRTGAEYERLRAQALIWQDATVTLLDRIGLAPGARCLDVGCGPGETMRLMAERVGRSGRVVGLDVDGGLGRTAVAALSAAGYAQCEFIEADAEKTEAVPAGGFDLVFGRLILLHTNDPAALLERMWEWVAPGGHLVVQDLDLDAVDDDPPTHLIAEWRRVFLGAFEKAGKDYRIGHHLPRLFAIGGPGFPDGIEVAGRVEQRERAVGMIAATYRSVAPAAVQLGLITEAQRDEWLADAAAAAQGDGEPRLARWPLMIGAYKQRR